MNLILFIILFYYCMAAPFAEFLAECPLSHRLHDDPLVFPNQPGASHLHDFFGSNITNAFTSSTCQILFQGTTCNPIVDKSAYWIPTLLDPLGNPVEIKRATFYYQNRDIEDLSSIQSFPNGLRIIAGDASATTVSTPRRVHWSCQGEPISGDDIVQCSAGNPNLEAFIRFPECWDGIHLDSPDHKSHMSYHVGGACPSSHPVALPVIEYKILYNTEGGSGYSLTSGNGLTLHGDVWIAWEDGEMELRVINCIRTGKKCDFLGFPLDGSAPILTSPPSVPSSCNNSNEITNGECEISLSQIEVDLIEANYLMYQLQTILYGVLEYINVTLA